MESRQEITDVTAKPVAKAEENPCELWAKGYTNRCIQLWPGQLERYCDGCINYAKEKVIAKYRTKR